MRAPAKTEVHIEDDVEPVPVERRDRADDPVEIGLVDAAALWLELRPIDPQTHDVEACLLHEGRVHLVERRRRVIGIGDQRGNIETAEQNLAPDAVDDLPIAGAQPAHRRLAVVRRRHRGRQAAGRQIRDDRQDGHDEQEPEAGAPQAGKAAPPCARRLPFAPPA